MSNGERELLGVRIPPELKRLVDADGRTNQDIVESALWREFGGKRLAVIEREIEEKENRLGQIDTEIDDRKDEQSELERDLEILRSRVKEMDENEPNSYSERAYQQELGDMGMVAPNPDNPPIQDLAEEYDKDAQTVAEDIAEMYDKEVKDEHEFDY